MKKLLLLFVLIFTGLTVSAQVSCDDLPSNEPPYNSGSSMTPGLFGTALPTLEYDNEDAFIVAITESGYKAGVLNSADFGNGSTIAIWGDDSSTDEIDGAVNDELVTLYLVDGDLMYTIGVSVNFVTNTQPPFFSTTQEYYCGQAAVPGCTFESSCNYNPDATEDDGSCYNNDLGCGCDTPAAVAGYDCDGYCLTDTDGDGICDEFEVLGCQDSNACNYNSDATDSGDCTYELTGYDCFGKCLVDADDDGVCDMFEVNGCDSPNACNYNSDATENPDDMYCTYPEESYLDCAGACINDTDGDGICNELEQEGCTNPLALNYNPNATEDNGDCTLPVSGCMDSNASNYDENANVDNGFCQFPGCTDEDALNYDENANQNDGSCIDKIFGCMDANAFNFNSEANVNEGCIDVILGCTNSSATNYNSVANTDDESCTFPAVGFVSAGDITNTGNNALISISTGAYTFSDGDLLGAFYEDENGDVQQAGAVVWDSSIPYQLMVVWGDDPNTNEIDGAHGEIIWKANNNGQDILLSPTYGITPESGILGDNQYNTNSAYLIIGFDAAILGCMDPAYEEYNSEANVEDHSCSLLFSDLFDYANDVIDNLEDDVDVLENELENLDIAFEDTINDFLVQLSVQQNTNDIILQNTIDSWTNLYNQDLADTIAAWNAEVAQMQSDWDQEVADSTAVIEAWTNDYNDAIAAWNAQVAQMQSDWNQEVADSTAVIEAWTNDYNDAIAAWNAQVAQMNQDWDDEIAQMQSDWDQEVADSTAVLNSWKDYYYGAMDSWNAEVVQMQSDWDAEVAQMQSDWNSQVAQMQSDWDQEVADSSAFITNLEIDLANTIASYELQLANTISAYEAELAADSLANANYISNLTSTHDFVVAGLEGNIEDLNEDVDGLNVDIEDLTTASAAAALSAANEIAGLEDDKEYLNSIIDAANQLYDDTSDSLDFYSKPIPIDLAQGWNMIGFQWQEEINVEAALAEITPIGGSTALHLIKNNSAAVYWPEFGFNSLQNLVPAQGYQVRMYSPVDGFEFPEKDDGQRLAAITQVPAWVYDMPIPNHPNDTRTLVTVMNMLGQEVNPEDAFKGEVLLYLYSDGTVEKSVK